MAAAIYTTMVDERTRHKPVCRIPTILVVDDECSVLQMVSDILQDEDLRVVTAESAQEALALAKREHPDLVITDLMMPGINGHTLRQRLQSMPGLTSTPVLLMTAAYQIQSPEEFAGIIPKPFDIDELLTQVHHHLNGD